MSKKLKISLIIFFAFIVLLLISPKVNATLYTEVVEGEATPTMLDFLPQTMELDMKESEFVKTEIYVYDYIRAELEKNNIILNDYSKLYNGTSNSTISIAFPKGEGGDTAPISTIKELDIVLEIHDSNNRITSYTKKINLQYSNSEDYNEEDQIYINELFETHPMSFLSYMEIDKLEIFGEAFIEKMKKDVVTFTKKEIQDDSVKIIPTGEVNAGGGMFRLSGFVHCCVIKNDIVYIPDVVIELDYQTALVIPDDIVNKKDCEEYALEKAMSFLADYASDISIKLDENGCYFEVYYSGDTESYENIVLMRAAGVHVGHNIFADNLPVDVGIDRQEIETNKKDAITEIFRNNGFENILDAHELKLVGLDELPEPIQITFSVGKEYDGKTVCIIHQKKDNTYEEFKNVKVINGQVTITVSELSPFVIGLEPENEQIITEEEISTGDTILGEKDDSPKMGTIDIVKYIVGIATIASVGIIFLRKKSK